MSNLARMAAEYFQAGGYHITRQNRDFFEAETADPDAALARVLLWADDTLHSESATLDAGEKAKREEREKAWLWRFAGEMKSAQGAAGYFLVPRRLGFSKTFEQEAKKLLRGGVRVPAQFFDSEYRYDEGGRKAKASVAASVFESAAKMKRVPQAFFRRYGLGTSDKEPGSGDILDDLKAWIAGAGRGPRFCLIDGAAGGGKTVAFNALAAFAYNAFIERKRRQGAGDGEDEAAAGRPIVFLPQHLRGTGNTGHVDDVIAAAIETDMAAPAAPGQLRWLLVNGFSLWMFDGLDEFYEGSEGFFAEIEAALSMPGSRASILICTRDSLLTSCAPLRAFVEAQLAKESAAELLELAPWGEASWRTIATMEFGEGAKATKFVSSLTASPVVAELAHLPFYCSVLLERFRKSGDLPSDEFELLDTVFERMIAREHDKAIFRWRDFVDEELLSDAIDEEMERAGELIPGDANARHLIGTLLDGQGKENVSELLCTLAHAYRRGEGEAASGLDAAGIKALSGISYLTSDMTRVDHVRRLNVLVQFAFFGAGRRAGVIDFTQPILADYLAARCALTLLRRGQHALNPAAGLRPSALAVPKAAIQQAVGTAPLDLTSIFYRYILQEIRRDRGLQDFLKNMKAQTFDRPGVQAFVQAVVAAL